MTLCLLSTHALGETEEISVGVLIERVIAGENFSGREIIVSGVALNKTTSGDRLVNIGTMETFRSSAYENFISVYDVGVVIRKGATVRIRIYVDESSAAILGGKNFVVIETTYRDCVSC